MAKTTLELVKAALAGRMTHKRHPFPGVDGQFVLLRTLTDGELDGCRSRAAQHCERSKVPMLVDPEMFDRALRREIIAMCCYESGGEVDKHSMFGSAEDVSELDDITVVALFELYQLHREMTMPWTSGDSDEVGALSEALGKFESSEVHLSSYDAPTLRRLLLSMARALRAKSQTSS